MACGLRFLRVALGRLIPGQGTGDSLGSRPGCASADPQRHRVAFHPARKAPVPREPCGTRESSAPLTQVVPVGPVRP